jgi:hypothetical protein
LARAFLGLVVDLQLPQTIIFAFLNAVVSVPFFLILDRLKAES